MFFPTFTCWYLFIIAKSRENQYWGQKGGFLAFGPLNDGIINVKKSLNED
jgi:hypothetical protein